MATVPVFSNMRFTTQGSLSSGAALKLKSMMALVYTGGLLAWLCNKNQIMKSISWWILYSKNENKTNKKYLWLPVSCGHTVSQLFRRGIRIQAKVQTKNNNIKWCSYWIFIIHNIMSLKITYQIDWFQKYDKKGWITGQWNTYLSSEKRAQSCFLLMPTALP